MEEREGKYSTPPDKPIEENQRPKEFASHRRSERKDEGQGFRKDEGQGSRKDEGQGSRKEEGHQAQEGVHQQNWHGQQGETADQANGSEESSEDQKSEEEFSEESEAEDEEKRHQGGSAESGRDKTVEVMRKLMQGMQQMQKQLMSQQSRKAKKGRDEDYREDEHIRANVEIHKLPEWNTDSAPVDFQDWMMVIHPQLCDIPNSVLRNMKRYQVRLCKFSLWRSL